jgi:hypothetical protein
MFVTLYSQLSMNPDGLIIHCLTDPGSSFSQMAFELFKKLISSDGVTGFLVTTYLQIIVFFQYYCGMIL